MERCSRLVSTSERTSRSSPLGVTMSLTRVMKVLDELEANLPRRHVLSLIDELDSYLPHTAFIDARTRQRLEGVRQRHKVSIHRCVPWTPGVGETYLPLFEATGSTVGRICVTRKERPGTFGTSLTQSTVMHVRAAFDGLSAALARMGAGVPDALERGHDVLIEHGYPESVRVDGPSLGLPMCLAMLSRYLQRAPRPDVAASAEVTVEGKLVPVGSIWEKVGALRREFPDTKTLLVAAKQEWSGHLDGIHVVRCERLEDAFRHCGLDVAPHALPAMTLDALRERSSGFKHRAVAEYVSTEWKQLSAQAASVSAALRPFDGESAAESMGWAALFALHGGDERLAAEYLRLVTAEDVSRLSPAPRVWYEIIAATRCIDGGTENAAAIVLGRRAVELAEELKGAERKHLLGRSLGTLGRALLHAANYDEALPHLRRAAELHKVERPEEGPRSLCYLATCLRLAGEAPAALETSQEGLTLSSRLPHAESAVTSRLFLTLERGRSLLALGRFDDALRDFLELERRQTSDADYPRLAGLRGLATVYAKLGNGEAQARMLERCLRVAEDDTRGPVLRKVAAYAAGDALVQGWDVADRARVADAWHRLHGPFEKEAVAAVLAAAVY
jgi:tetratricopeptide (TPR) repeat protein